MKAAGGGKAVGGGGRGGGAFWLPKVSQANAVPSIRLWGRQTSPCAHALYDLYPSPAPGPSPCRRKAVEAQVTSVENQLQQKLTEQRANALAAEKQGVRNCVSYLQARDATAACMQ